MGIKSTFSDLYHENTNYKFTSRMWRWLLVSGILLAISLGSFIVNGLNTSIEFKGGTSFEVSMAKKSPDISAVRDLLADNDLGELKIQIVNDTIVKVTAKRLTQAEQAAVIEELSKYSGTDQSEVSISDVGPSWGKKVTQESTRALIVFFLIVGLYMILRFEWTMSLGAIISMLPDADTSAVLELVTEPLLSICKLPL